MYYSLYPFRSQLGRALVRSTDSFLIVSDIVLRFFPLNFPSFTKSYNSETHFSNVRSASPHRASHITIARPREREEKRRKKTKIHWTYPHVLSYVHSYSSSCKIMLHFFCSPCQAMVQQEKETEAPSCLTIFDILYTFFMASRSK